MGSSSLNTPFQAWTPADAVLRDCSQGICSFYCPQWCSVIYPPPPTPSFTAIGVAAAAAGDDADDESSSFRLSPLIVALIGILASAFVLITYYTIISRFCTRRGRVHQNDINQLLNDNNESAVQVPSSSSNTGGLDDAVIRSITVRKYKKGDRLIEGTDCSVCLSEFQESENLRLLPKCNHAFHLPCIDTWLKSHSSCPLCRSNIVISNTSSSSSGNLPNQRESPQSQEASRAQSVNVSALEYQYRNDTVIVIHGLEQQIQVDFGGNLEERNGSESNQGGLLLVADILRSSGDEEDDDDEEVEIGSSKGNGREGKRKVRLG